MINKMKKLLCACRASDKERVLKLLRCAETVHLETIQPDSAKVPEEITQSFADCSKAIMLLKQTETSAEGKLAAPGTPVRLVEETLAHDKAVNELKAKQFSLSQELEYAKDWGPYNLKDLEYIKENGIKVVFCKGEYRFVHEIEAEAVEVLSYGIPKDASGVTSREEFFEALDKKNNYMCVFAAASRNKLEIPKELHIINCPSRELDDILNELSACKKEIADHENALACILMRLKDILAYQTKLINKLKYAQAEAGALDDSDLFVILGWVPEDKTLKLSQGFESEKLPAALDFQDPTDDETPPTQLNESSWVKSIEPLFDFMGIMPTYRMPDTSGIFLATLAVFSAFLIADGGYGIAALLALVIAYKPLIKRGADEKTLNLGIILSGAVTVYGFLTNAWFGVDYKMFSSYGFNPGTPDGMVFMQGLCFLIGVCHLTLAHVIKAMRKTLSITHLADVGWIVFLWAMYGLICMLILRKPFVLPFELVIPLFEVALPLILLFTAPSLEVHKMLWAGLGAIVGNASNCFSDIISYIRLWAVGVAGGKVAGAFNDIAAMLPILGALPVYVCGHAVNLILGVIAILAHGVRLNLLEFSNHLDLDWSGRKYEPFKEIK